MKVVFRGKTYHFDKSMKVKDLLRQFHLSPESTLVVRDEEVLTEEEMIKEGEEVRVISAISGGNE